MSTAAASEARAARAVPPQPGEGRYLALDAFRGFIMILLASEGFGFTRLLNHPVYGGMAAQFEHVSWEGAVFWDLVQPAFMFIVGVAMPFALARRIDRGATFAQNLGHVSWRAFKLILLSQVLISISAGKPGFQLINVLSQIAFTYFFCFLILQLRFRWQVVAAALILAGHWALFAVLPGADGPFSKADNAGAFIDRALGLHYRGLYVTINFVTSIVTTLFGAWAGNLVRSARPRNVKLGIVALWSAGCFAGALALSAWVPIVKRIWTASFTLSSAGWVLLMLLGFLLLIEVAGLRRFAFPLLVVGMNSIFIYSISMVLKGWIRNAVGVFTGSFWFLGDLAPVGLACASLAVMWYMCYWLYQRKIFFKL